MTIFEEGNLVDAFVVSSGLAGMDTPKGEYTIHNKALRTWSARYAALHAVLDGDYARREVWDP
jgi:hypothetical protein